MIIIPDIIEEFIGSLNFSFPIQSSVFAAGQTTIVLDNILHLREGLQVTLGGGPVSVVSVDHGAESFVVAGDYSSETTTTLPVPFFFHGTPLSTNNHLSKLDDASKVPMVYLMEVIRKRFGGTGSSVKSAELDLFFLDVANFVDWSNDDHYSNVVVPQNKLIDYFIESISTSKYFWGHDGGEVIDHAKFGQFFSLKGKLNSLFNDRLSGAQLKIRINFVSCCC